MCCHSTYFCVMTVLLACARTKHVDSAIVALYTLCTYEHIHCSCSFTILVMQIIIKKLSANLEKVSHV